MELRLQAGWASLHSLLPGSAAVLSLADNISLWVLCCGSMGFGPSESPVAI
jgi:hypothetical protein